MDISVSVVSTILNARKEAENLLYDLCQQTRLPDEFVIVDGGSNDGTFEYLLSKGNNLPFNLILIQESGANVSRGRNIAIENTSYHIILSTDFGCRLDKNWISEIIKPYEVDPTTEIVVGSWFVRKEDIQTPAQWAEWALAGGTIGLRASPTALASTRSMAFKKHVWEEFGKYPEDLTLAGDDAIFSKWMVIANRKLSAAPDAKCYWHRFPYLQQFWQEARRNFRGAGEAIFFLNYGIKVGLLTVLEFTSLIVFMLVIISYIFDSNIKTVITAAVFLALIWSRRIYRWSIAIYFLAKQKKVSCWPWVIALDIGIRINSVIGYWVGFIYGCMYCRKCRQRMQELSVPRW